MRLTLGLSLLCLAVFSSYTLAQPTPPAPEPKADPKDKPEAAPKDKAEGKSEPAPDVKPEAKAKPKSTAQSKKKAKGQVTRKRSRKRATFKMNPDAKWACDQTTVTLDPIWRGGPKKLTFDFEIRNEGTADLQIKAAGG